jgi:hypothetical protein
MDEQYVLRQEDLVENPTARFRFVLSWMSAVQWTENLSAELNEGVSSSSMRSIR